MSASESSSASSRVAADNAERALGRYVAFGLPVVAAFAAAGAWAYAGPGPAMLVLAASALLGTIALLWSSVRTLSGDAPLPEDLEALAARRHGVDNLAEQKGTVLRALKDLDHEHEVGKIDDADYETLRGEYRARAKEILRQMDASVEPLRPRAEQIARAYLEKRGLGAAAEASKADEKSDVAADAPAAADKPSCAKCSTVNDADAAFCKKCGTPLRRESEANDDASS
jgi:hypothetical protein